MAEGNEYNSGGKIGELWAFDRQAQKFRTIMLEFDSGKEIAQWCPRKLEGNIKIARR